MSGYGRFCDGDWCAFGHLQGAYKRIRPFFRNIKAIEEIKRPFPKHLTACVWHIRAGSIVLHSSVEFILLLKTLLEVAPSLAKIQFFFLSENFLCTEVHFMNSAIL